MELQDFKQGIRVCLKSTVRHADVAGQLGTVERIVKSRKMVVVRLDSGRRYDAFPENVEMKEVPDEL